MYNSLTSLFTVVCEDLSIHHGGISYHSTAPGPLRAENSTAIYTCEVGYNLTGESTRTCETNASGNGEWNGTEPSCIGNPKI